MAKLGLVVDLDTCVGCHANVDRATACSLWNAKSDLGQDVNCTRPMHGISLTRGEK